MNSGGGLPHSLKFGGAVLALLQKQVLQDAVPLGVGDQ